ncbi:MAG TPA: hypothetical protein VKE30_10495 [Chthoniobacterales bacterium]|nr:hypothetical protein [Chthoniobacterales bacterium]
MKLGNSAILAIVIAGCFSLTAYVMGQGRSGGHTTSAMGSTGMTNSQFGRNTAATAPTRNTTPNPHIKTSPTPPGKHLGWQKGRHNPHHSPTP